MSLYILLFVSSCAFGALKWWLIPRARKAASKSQKPEAGLADNWDERNDPVCPASQLAHHLVELDEISQLRKTLGVTDARRQLVALSRTQAPACPALH